MRQFRAVVLVSVTEADLDAVISTTTQDICEETAYNPTKLHVLSQQNLAATRCASSEICL